MRLVTLCLAGLLVAFSGTATPAQAELQTSMDVVSAPGEQVGQGQTVVLTPGDGVFDAHRNPLNGVTVTFHNADYSKWWQLDFANGSNAPLAEAFYGGVIRYPDGAYRAQMQASSQAYSCTLLTGYFEIKKLVWESDIKVAKFWATLTQQCEGGPPLQIEIQYNLDVSTKAMPATWGRIKQFYR